jgi:hypothetical protein
LLANVDRNQHSTRWRLPIMRKSQRYSHHASAVSVVCMFSWQAAGCLYGASYRCARTRKHWRPKLKTWSKHWRQRCAGLYCMLLCAHIVSADLRPHGLTHQLAQDEALAAKDAELEQALATVTAAKVCFFHTISLSQRDRYTDSRRMKP